MRKIYATDASVYRELPLAIAHPKCVEDIRELILFANENNLSLIPRSGGTSLAGQCVGNGIVVDVSRYLYNVIEINEKGKYAWVEPGIVRDELNQILKSTNLMFGPDTATSNRATIGGMIGNNSSGLYSLTFGVTRNHVLELEMLLSDGNLIHIKSLNQSEFDEKCCLETLEGDLYRFFKEKLSTKTIQQEIKEQYPHPSIHRRNTGYALDELLKMIPFSENGKQFNLSELIAGSEGTLGFITKVKVKLSPVLSKHFKLVCPHFSSINDALRTVESILTLEPTALELIDKVIIDCTKESKSQSENRFFINKNPAAVLIVELREENDELLVKKIGKIQQLLINKKCDSISIVDSENAPKVWNLRKAGLGLLSNVEGKAKPVAVIEDTAVTIKDLPNYIADFDELMKKFNQESVYYAHAGAGELHLRPILDLSEEKDKIKFKEIAKASAELVKKYKGSLSGEHGDGRVRAEFIPQFYGEMIYNFFCELKSVFDENNIFNAGKIVHSKPMDEDFRANSIQTKQNVETLLDFGEEGMLAVAEKCNGAGDCRKLSYTGSVMCPSYMATRDEQHSTRARANVLREFLGQNIQNPLAQEEIKEVLDLCVGCKGCSSECPSNVDVSMMKTEFLHQYHEVHGRKLRDYFFGYFHVFMKMASLFPSISNVFMKTSLWKFTSKKLGITTERDFPKVSSKTAFKLLNNIPRVQNPIKTVYLFIDEFTNYNEAELAEKTVNLLSKLNYQVKILKNPPSGRALISKGFLKDAKKIAQRQIDLFSGIISEENPLLGIEPSAVSCFKDEYVKLLRNDSQQKAIRLAQNVHSVEKFLFEEMKFGNIQAEQFTTDENFLKVHIHCHQKAVSSIDSTLNILSLPRNYHVEFIPTSCCGMAGSFGYETEHFEISNEMAELNLLQNIRKSDKKTTIVANGTSCRHQILDNSDKKVFHPIEILNQAFTH